jgi:Fe-S-cluster containining protein
MNLEDSSKLISHELNVTLTAFASLEPFATVPCGSCTLCCRSLSPILTPIEISSGKYPLGFMAGAKGPIVTMYKNPETGGCSMFKEDKCSIYEDRPVACRQFDCRKGHAGEEIAKLAATMMDKE